LAMAQPRLEHHPHVLQVLRTRLGEVEVGIAVHLHETAEHRWARVRAAEDRVHVPHENRWHAMQAEGADPKLLLAARDAESCLALILLANAELHVGRASIRSECLEFR
jgi:hypothetical protein